MTAFSQTDFIFSQKLFNLSRCYHDNSSEDFGLFLVARRPWWIWFDAFRRSRSLLWYVLHSCVKALQTWTVVFTHDQKHKHYRFRRIFKLGHIEVMNDAAQLSHSDCEQSILLKKNSCSPWNVAPPLSFCVLNWPIKDADLIRLKYHLKLICKSFFKSVLL